MRIGIPVRFTPGDGGGIEIYAVNLVERLQTIDRKNNYSLFCSRLNERVFRITNRRFEKIFPPGKDGDKTNAPIAAKPTIDRLFAKIFPRKRKSPRSRDFSEVDLFHFMFTIIPPDLLERDYEVPLVLTVHDIQQEYHPEFFSDEILEFRRKMYRPSMEKADHIVAISDFTQKSLIEKYQVPEEKITVVKSGFDRQAFRPMKPGVVERMRKKYGLPEKFFFYPAATWPHKNHLNLCKAYKIMKDRFGHNEKMVWTGTVKENHDFVLKEIKMLGLSDDIVHLGYVPYSDLPGIFNAASLLVFPSFFEGFGIPVLEAMATGLPVACSNSSSLPEVAGDAAIFFNPNNPENMAEQIHALQKDQDLKRDLAQRGLLRTRLFSWKNTANQMLDVYHRTYAAYYYG